jgi:UTP-glucose-1-phosphate uridylyltransferase
MNTTLVVLAAGMGSRYGGTKQIDAMGPNNETIIEYSVYDAIKAGFTKVVFIIRDELSNYFKENIEPKFKNKIKIVYVYQSLDAVPQKYLDTNPIPRKKPWGTGHAILMCKMIVNEPFLVINADDFYGQDTFAIAKEAILDNSEKPNNKDLYHIITYTLKNTLSDNGVVSRGVCTTTQSNYLLNIEEHSKISFDEEQLHVNATNLKEEPVIFTGEEDVSMNVLGFTPEIFTHLEKQFDEFLLSHNQESQQEFFIPTVMNRLMQEEKAVIKVTKSMEKWFGLTYKEDKEVATKKIKELIELKIYPESI